MQFGVSSLIHTAALARWTSVSFFLSETVSTVFGRDLEGHQKGQTEPVPILGY